MADENSIFIRGLRQFKHRSLYANVLNDRTVPYYTASISQTDPYERPDAVKVNYLDSYEDVIVDSNNPISAKEPEAPLMFRERLAMRASSFFSDIPMLALFMVFVPIGTTFLFANAAIQSVRSAQRIKLHEEGKTGVDIKGYRMPVLLKSARREIEGMFENMNNQQRQDYLDESQEAMASPTQQRRFSFAVKPTVASASDSQSSIEKPESGIDLPTLALTEHQFKMIENLDNVGFQKYPVYIHKHRHTHAAIIRRIEKPSFDEGRIVARHWLDQFEI